jgi:hypothetical protein
MMMINVQANCGFSAAGVRTTLNHANKRQHLFYDFALTTEQVKQPLKQTHLCNCAYAFFSTREK